ncbi:hypothetical protein Cgig2_027996 [Carnegiea gigantea]|uniref:PAP-associated domain-containing protein n=1 Tax=Carnegiea gigantea TaxID=171969 RepID=A0A9Q1GP78_9CARY|nr:hypothetical protein Cgig2_027996 [Carnegiea gigantea]
MEAVSYSYETLSPLLPSFATAAEDIRRSPTTASIAGDDPDEYVVFRNEISLSTNEAAAPEAAAPDFFSLDVNDSPDKVIRPTPSPVVQREADLERTLESGWFRPSCRFKSPMLQLHKGNLVKICGSLARLCLKSALFILGETDNKAMTPICSDRELGGSWLADGEVVILESNIRTPQIGLQALAKALSQRCLAKKIQVIGKARVPIIKFVEMETNVAFDISFDVENGPKAAEYIKVYSGGIGSYALLAMLIAMLRSVNELQRFPEQNVGILLVKFFEFYAHKLNTWDVGISCCGRGTFFLKSSKGFQIKGRPFLISIEDPQTSENDIGKNSFNYFQVPKELVDDQLPALGVVYYRSIRSAFMMAYSTLTNTKTIMNLGPNRSILGTIIRPDPVLLERKGGSNGQVTFNSLLPGAGELLDSQYDEKQDMLCNWRFDNDYEEEPLPRGGGAAESSGASSSGKKRKASKTKSSQKVMENGSVGRHRSEENGSHMEKKREKKRSKF